MMQGSKNTRRTWPWLAAGLALLCGAALLVSSGKNVIPATQDSDSGAISEKPRACSALRSQRPFSSIRRMRSGVTCFTPAARAATRFDEWV